MWSNSSFSEGGGGFLPAGSSPSTFSQQDKPQRRFRAQTLVPMTIGHVLKAMSTSDAITIGDIEVNMVSIMGLVKSVEIQTTHIEYVIDDMTGPPIKIQHFIDDSNEDCKPMVENMYVQVYGSPKKMRGEIHLNAFKILPVTNLNQLTLHLTEVMHAKYMAEKKLPEMQNKKINFDGNTSAALNSTMEVDMAGDMEGVPSGLTKNQALVYQTIKTISDYSGCSVDNIVGHLRTLSRSVIRDALTFLCNEGHIYSTLDEDHFAITG